MGNALGAPAEPGACIGDLDDGDLGRIFSLAGRQHGPTVTLVCRKWREVFWSEPDLWRSIRLARPSRSAEEEAAGAAQQLRMLRRVAQHVQAAEVSAMHYGPQPPEAATWHAAALLLELPETLRALALRHIATLFSAPACLPEVALEGLPRFAPALTRLELASSRLAARPAAAALAQLPNLRHLALHMGAVSGDALQAAQQLHALTRLELGAPPAELPARLPELLGALSQLRELACLGCGVLPAGAVAALAELPKLEALTLAMSLPGDELRQLARLPALRRLELCERRWGTGSLELPPPAAFRALQSYRFWREAEGGFFVVAGAQLRSCTYADGTLEVGELRQPPASLQVLAEALLPGGVRAAPAAPALAGLVLREAALSAEALQACPLLEGLRLLHLRCCWAVPDEGMAPPVHPWAWTVAQCGDLLPGVQLLLGQAPALEQLMLSRCRLGLGLSSGAGGEALDVSSSPQLRRLALHSAEACTTARLLSATFPAGLEEVDLEEAYPPIFLRQGSPLPPAPAVLPPGLAACTALRRLRLRGLRLPEGLAAGVLEGLVELEVRRCGLERLPPGLSAATALTRLTLDVNKDLALSYGEADVLRRLPRLRALQAQYTTTPPRVAAHLHVLAPCLEAVWSLGQAFHRLVQRSDRQWRVLLMGLDAAGVSTALRHLGGAGPIQTSVPYIGFNVESIQHRNLHLAAVTVDRSMGSPFWALVRALPLFQGLGGLVYVVDSLDRDRLAEVRQELARLLQWEDALQGRPLLLLANKQDLPAALEPQRLAQRLGVPTLCQQRRWHAQGTSMHFGEGLFEGFDWLARTMAGVD